MANPRESHLRVRHAGGSQRSSRGRGSTGESSCRGLPAKVNLIPWNELPDLAYERPSARAIEQFRLQVLRSGLDALVRYSRGTDIAAACGQLHAAVAR